MIISIDDITLGLNTPYTIERVDLSIPKINLVSKPLPSTNRSQSISNFIKQRVIKLNGFIVANSSVDFETKRDELATALYPEQGKKLSVTIETAGNNTKTTTALLQDFQAEFDVDDGLTVGQYSLELFCEDPNFYDTLTTTQNLFLNPGGLEFDFGFDADLGNNQGNSISFAYNGTVAVLPMVTVTGPANRIMITKNGKSFMLNVVLFAGQKAIIDTEEELVTIDDVSYYSYASGFKNLEITTGLNTFDLFVFSDNNTNTKVEFTFRNAYISI